MSEREDQLIDKRHDEVMAAIKGVHTRLDVLNGRTRKLEVEQGVLKWAVASLTTGVTAFVVWLIRG